jgi:hypothetical protein
MVLTAPFSPCGAHRAGTSHQPGTTMKRANHKLRTEHYMSEFPIQTTSLDELKGGQRPLVSDDRRGNEHWSQVFPLTGRPGKQVDNDQPGSAVKPNDANGAGSRPPENVSGMNAGSGRAISVTPVDSNNLEGSNKGDHRSKPGDTAKSSLTQAAQGANGPRNHVGQFPNGKNDAVNGSFGKDYHSQQFPTPDDGD